MKKSSGFSLLEMVMVITIITILAATIVPRLSVDAITLAAQAEQLASDIRYTQTLAMTQGKRYVIFGPSLNSYQIEDSSGTLVANPQTASTAAVTLTASLAATNLPSGLITFDGKGIPYIDIASPGTPLAAVASVVLTQNGATKTVTIQPGTGRVDVP